MIQLLFTLAWKVLHIEHYCAKTTVRLWHELHVARLLAHDFQSMIHPTNGFFMGFVENDEIQAIAQCNIEGIYRMKVDAIAHAPNQIHSAVKFVNILSTTNIAVNYKHIRMQPRIYCESLYHLNISEI